MPVQTRRRPPKPDYRVHTTALNHSLQGKSLPLRVPPLQSLWCCSFTKSARKTRAWLGASRCALLCLVWKATPASVHNHCLTAIKNASSIQLLHDKCWAMLGIKSKPAGSLCWHSDVRIQLTEGKNDQKLGLLGHCSYMHLSPAPLKPSIACHRAAKQTCCCAQPELIVRVITKCLGSGSCSSTLRHYSQTARPKAVRAIGRITPLSSACQAPAQTATDMSLRPQGRQSGVPLSWMM